MEQVYERDLSSATEVVLDMRRKLRAPGRPHRPRAGMGSGRGSANRAAAGALRLGNALGAAFAGRRVLGPVEAWLMLAGGALIAACAILIALFPRLLAYPLAALAGWFACALVFRAWRLRRRPVDARDDSRGGKVV
jgi:cardiolipin synthase